MPGDASAQARRPDATGHDPKCRACRGHHRAHTCGRGSAAAFARTADGQPDTSASTVAPRTVDFARFAHLTHDDARQTSHARPDITAASQTRGQGSNIVLADSARHFDWKSSGVNAKAVLRVDRRSRSALASTGSSPPQATSGTAHDPREQPDGDSRGHGEAGDRDGSALPDHGGARERLAEVVVPPSAQHGMTSLLNDATYLQDEREQWPPAPDQFAIDFESQSRKRLSVDHEFGELNGGSDGMLSDVPDPEPSPALCL